MYTPFFVIFLLKLSNLTGIKFVLKKKIMYTPSSKERFHPRESGPLCFVKPKGQTCLKIEIN